MVRGEGYITLYCMWSKQVLKKCPNKSCARFIYPLELYSWHTTRNQENCALNSKSVILENIWTRQRKWPTDRVHPDTMVTMPIDKTTVSSNHSYLVKARNEKGCGVAIWTGLFATQHSTITTKSVQENWRTTVHFPSLLDLNAWLELYHLFYVRIEPIRDFLISSESWSSHFQRELLN